MIGTKGRMKTLHGDCLIFLPYTTLNAEEKNEYFRHFMAFYYYTDSMSCFKLSLDLILFRDQCVGEHKPNSLLALPAGCWVWLCCQRQLLHILINSSRVCGKSMCSFVEWSGCFVFAVCVVGGSHSLSFNR